MQNKSTEKPKTLLLVGTWINRNWILGNWIKEIKNRSSETSRIHWTISVYAGKHFWESLVKWPLPKCDAYFFSYPAIFESYQKTNPKKYSGKSIVNYTHNMEELGTLQHQAEILNKAFSVHFNCSKNAKELISAGLQPEKVRILYGAVDKDCKLMNSVPREDKTILLASRFGERKGVEILPEIVKLLPDWKFIILGRGWENFLKESGLSENQNVEYEYFDRYSRNIAMSRATIFLSLSKVEGGPIPLIESMSLGVKPIATDTGFAPDLIKDGINGIILPNPPTPDQVVSAILNSEFLNEAPQKAVEGLNWDRISKIVEIDATEIWSKVS